MYDDIYPLSEEEFEKEFNGWAAQYEAERGIFPQEVVVPAKVYKKYYKTLDRIRYVRVVGSLYLEEDGDIMRDETVLRRTIRVRGMNVEDFAVYCGIKRSRMFNIVNGSVIPSVCEAITIAENLDANILHLWGKDGALV